MYNRLRINFKLELKLHQIRQNRFFIAFKCKQFWIARLKARGHTYDELQRRTVKCCLTSGTFWLIRANQERAKIVVRKFLRVLEGKHDLKERIVSTYKKLFMIQTKLRDKMITIDAKVEVLVNMWDKILGKITIAAQKQNDALTKNLATQLFLVPKEIRWNCFKLYIKNCRMLHSIAFLQWRLKFPKDGPYRSESELQEIIASRLAHL
jgi:hypothetical protein